MCAHGNKGTPASAVQCGSMMFFNSNFFTNAGNTFNIFSWVFFFSHLFCEYDQPYPLNLLMAMVCFYSQEFVCEII